MTVYYIIFHLQNLGLLNKFMKSLIIKLSVFASILILTGCQTIDIRGQYVEDAAIAQLQTRTMTKAEVVNLIGTPTIVPDYTPNTWYYVQRSLARRAWFDPKVIEQRIVEVRFNNKDVVSEVLVLNDLQIDEIKSSSEYTKTYGTEANDIQKFVRNIGRFNKTTDGKKKGKKK
jgi:outer membrane protein assembly factor BamE (lipoprotein component of BamABCDE complex)